MRNYRLYQVDAFTRRRFAGNPAGVVSNADGLSASEMQQIARELNNSETAFLMSSSGPDHDVWIRYFTPTTEVPVCGHATIAAHFVRATESKGRQRHVRQLCGAGVLSIEIAERDGDYLVWMTQGKIEIHPPFDAATVSGILAGCGLSHADLDPRCPVQIVSTGHSKVMIGLRQRAAIDVAKPDLDALCATSRSIGCNGYFLFTQEAGGTYGRMFAPAIGIPEDPVTGNANGPLGAYLVHHRLMAHDGECLRFEGRQGDVLGRPGVVTVEVSITDQVPAQVRIAGQAVIAFSATLDMD